MSSSTQADIETKDGLLERFVSLASGYRVDVLSGQDSETWTLSALDDMDGRNEEEKAKNALKVDKSESNYHITLRGTRNGDDLVVTADSNTETSLIASLSRIVVQRLTSRLHGPWNICLTEEEPTVMQELDSDSDVLDLFKPILGTTEVELVEMVDRNGIPLGRSPRPLVHSFNLLHRGIGMVITKDTPILSSGMTNFPDLYVHRRTDTKRIFPSLYDMFVGGVSSAGEDAKLTAKREVAEELGLSRALTDEASLSEPLFCCTVCTSYNRCVVTVFCYTFDSTQDSVSWQKEEVAWGSFVPYSVVQSSAVLCVKRMVASKSWPGASPDPLLLEDQDSSVVDNYHGATDWKKWDFVPDGLLVWEAWLQWQNSKSMAQERA